MMIVLSISKINNKEYVGININIPTYVKSLNNVCKSAYLDLGNEQLKKFENYEYYFTRDKIKKFDISCLPAPFNKPDIVVFQSLYIKEFIPIYKYLKKNKIPYTIIPRCSMTCEAQKRKRLKKLIGNLLFYNKFIKDATFIHFLTLNEKERSKNFKIKNSVVIGNGTGQKKIKYSVKTRNEYKVIYIGRYDIYHKGLDVLLEAINIGKEYFEANNIHFYLYGSDFENNLALLQKKKDDLGLQKVLSIGQAVFGDEKEKKLLDADVFIQTSRLEGHPTGVIEAISYGIPVITTPGTNLYDDVKKYNIGFVAELNSNDICSAIIKSYKSKKEFEKISQNAINYANKNFDWNSISKKIVKQYSLYIGNK